jgi:3-methyladenine DNA glycosylase/8-oxoguanine DNA glycosylase
MFNAQTEIAVRKGDAFDFSFACKHYNIYPWIENGSELLRVARLTDQAEPVLVRIAESSSGRDKRLLLSFTSARVLAADQLGALTGRIQWALGLTDEVYPRLRDFAAGDKVIEAALRINRGIRFKRYLDPFEAICGAICAQNVDFRRLYQMMKALAVAFGPAIHVGGIAYHAFPSASEIATASEEDLRACKVGYRAKLILGASRFLDDQPEHLNMEVLKSELADRAAERLCAVPGIGPYSAGIVLGAGIGRLDVFHLDSFTRLILRTFYFGGREVADADLLAFTRSKWGPYAGAVAHLLTTNTQEWAFTLGHENFRRSGARI